MAYRALYLTALMLASAVAAAQPAFMVSPDTVWYSEPYETAFSITSQDSDTLRLSFPETDPSFPFYGTESGVQWFFVVETPDSLYNEFSLPYLFSANPLPDLRLAPGQTASFQITGIDPCPLCRPSAAPSDTLSDRLHLRVSNGTGADTATVVLETSRPTSSEAGPDTVPFRVGLYPNPTRGPLAVGVEANGFWVTEAVVLDVLGRTVRRFHVRADETATADLSSLPAGAYFLRVGAPDGGTVTERFVLLD